MAEEEKKDVEKDSSTSPDPDEEKVDSEEEKGDDKDKNFAELRKKNKELADKNKELEQRLEDGGEERSLKPGENDDKDKSDKDKSGKDALEVVFERDLKEATRQWNGKNEATKEEWAQVQKKVTLSGEETLSEIYEKIDEAYNSIPSVRKKREESLIKKGREDALKEMTDDELDLGGGGDVDLGGDAEGSLTRLTPKEKGWVKGLGVSKEGQKKIKKDGNPSDWDILDPQYKKSE